MIGNKYWSTGISVKPRQNMKGSYDWTATAEFFDDGWCDNESSQGLLEARYCGELSSVIDVVKRDVEALGIEWRNINDTPMLYCYQDGEDKDWRFPDDWRELLREEAKRIGFNCLY